MRRILSESPEGSRRRFVPVRAGGGFFILKGTAMANTQGPKTSDGWVSPALRRMRRMTEHELRMHRIEIEMQRSFLVNKLTRLAEHGQLAGKKARRIAAQESHLQLLILECEQAISQRLRQQKALRRAG
jgi:hypothetical protein